jgi:BolA protein
MTNRVRMIEERLRQRLAPEDLAVTDESHLHAGHAGARTGKGHFAVSLCSPRFAGVPPLERHRMVYAALGEIMEREIHALRIDARAPGEDIPR